MQALQLWLQTTILCYKVNLFLTMALLIPSVLLFERTNMVSGSTSAKVHTNLSVIEIIEISNITALFITDHVLLRFLEQVHLGLCVWLVLM